MPEYTWIFLNLPEWVLFYGVSTYFNLNTKLEVIVWRKMRLFSWRNGSIWFIFCFRINIFIDKISNLLLPCEARGQGRRPWVLVYPVLINFAISLIAFWLCVKVPMPAQRFPGSDWPILEILKTHPIDALKLASKMYPIKHKAW